MGRAWEEGEGGREQLDYGAFDKVTAASVRNVMPFMSVQVQALSVLLSGQAHMNGYAAAWVRVRAAFGDR